MDLGDELRERRKQAGRTIASVAADAGLSVPYIANLENGRGNPTLAALDRLATALGTRLTVSLGEPEDEQPPGVGAELLAGHRRAEEVLARLATGRSRHAVREQLEATVDALAGVLGRTPAEADLDRLLDLLVLGADFSP